MDVESAARDCPAPPPERGDRLVEEAILVDRPAGWGVMGEFVGHGPKCGESRHDISRFAVASSARADCPRRQQPTTVDGAAQPERAAAPVSQRLVNMAR
jgi:hypothetical protein